MDILRYLPLCAVLLIFASIQPVLAQDCSSLSTQTSRTQHTLYEYALIADAAHGHPSSNSCLVEATQRRLSMPRLHRVPLLPEDIETRWKPQILERWRAEIFLQPSDIGRYIGDDGVTYITCAYDDITPQLALTWTEFWRTRENEDAHSDIGVSLRVLAVISRTTLPPDEELGVIRLSRDPPSSSEPEKLVAIRGTDFTKIPQIMASVHHLLSGSCVYELAALVVSEIGHEVSSGRFSVVGHSLGGGAAQYVVQDYAQHPWRNPANRQNYNVTFAAYSYNSIGLDRSFVGDVDPSILYSYFIKGEIVSWLGRQFGRRQGGSVFRYDPPASWPSTGTLSLVGSILGWNQPETIRRHRLAAVQQGLCQCINGYGSVVLSNP